MSPDTPSPRHPTAAAIAAVAKRFRLPQNEHMQDWEHEVADSERIDEFLDAYLAEPLTDDERFVLMEVVVQSCEDHPVPLELQPRWAEVVQSLRDNVSLHASTIRYWSSADDRLQSLENLWRVTPTMWEIVADRPDVFDR